MTQASQVQSAPRAKAPALDLIVLGALAAFATVSTDMYLPSLPAMARDLHAQASIAALTVATFFAGIAIGQLVYGPLSDRIGRRTPLHIGVALYVTASIGCVFANSIEWLVVLRLLQGLGGCSGIVIGRAIVRDRFDAQQTASIYSVLQLVLSLGPVLAPSIGGLVLLFGDWRMIFCVLTLFGLACGLSAFFVLKESRPEAAAVQARSESPFRSYWLLLSRPRIIGYTVCGALSQAALLTYVANVPDLMIGTFHVSPQAFGWLFGINGIGLLSGTQINRLLLRRFKYDVILERANIAGILIALALVVDAATNFGGLWGIAVPLFFIVLNMGFIQSNSLAGAMAIDPTRAGSTSALFGCSQFAFGAACAGIAASFHDGTGRPMALVIFGAMIIAGIALRLLAKPANA